MPGHSVWWVSRCPKTLGRTTDWPASNRPPAVLLAAVNVAFPAGSTPYCASRDAMIFATPSSCAADGVTLV